MSRGQPSWKKELFDDQRRAYEKAIDAGRIIQGSALAPYLKNSDGWILFGPQDVRYGKREYHFSLIYTVCDRTLRVRAGCRFYTIEQAWKHWGGRRYFNKGAGKQALAIITLMLLQAHSHALTNTRQSRRYFYLNIPTPKQPKRTRR